MVKPTKYNTRSKTTHHSSSDSGSESDIPSVDDNETFNHEEFTKLLGTLFPSKYLSEKTKKPKKKIYKKDHKKLKLEDSASGH